MNANPACDAAEPYVKRTQSGALVTLTLNRGERFNPLSMGMIAELELWLDELASDTSARVVVLRGAGRGFCAGHDLQEIHAFERDLDYQTKLFESCNRMMLKINQLPQPVIARVHGVATAAGCQLVSICDLAVADEATRFALPGVNVGLFCSTPAVGVVRSIGRKRSMEMLLTGDTISAAQALEWGLINRVVATANLDSEVQLFTDRILARSAAAISIGKKSFYAQVDLNLKAAFEVAGRAMVSNLALRDASEGIEAFLTKRAPNWRNV
jgi:enoyl-CoA hydratase/carnithine racemase